MKKTVFALAVSVLGLQACVVAPPQSAVYVSPPPGVVVPPGVVYVAPTYPAPSIDFVWSSTPNMVGGGDILNAVGIVAGVELRQPSQTFGDSQIRHVFFGDSTIWRTASNLSSSGNRL